MKRRPLTPIDHQLLSVISEVVYEVKSGLLRHDWLDGLKYGLLFNTPDEIFRLQCFAAREAEEHGRAFTPVFWTGEPGGEPVMTLWRIP